MSNKASKSKTSSNNSSTKKKKTTAASQVLPAKIMPKITFDDVSINHFTVLNYLDAEFFSDSTVTMSNDAYLKNAIRDRLLQVIFFTEGVISLNRDANILNRAMLRSSLNDKDIDIILNSSLNISSVQLEVKTKEELADGDNAKLQKRLDSERKTLGSIEALIGIIEDNLGATRVKYSKLSDEDMQDAIKAGYSVTSLPPESVSIEKPLVLNLDFLDLKTFSPGEIESLVTTIMSIDSNTELVYKLKATHFTARVIAFFKELEDFLDVAIAHARKASNNSVLFVPEANPFEQLWNAL